MHKKITLDSGLRIITIPMPESLTTTLLVLVEAGSKYESKEINGLSHFLEHMCFKGTEKRPKIIDISTELDSIGASYNAFTSHEYTGYFAKARPKHFDEILDVVSDVYLNPIFRPEEIDKEKGVIIEEINLYEDLPMRRVQELFMFLLYGDQPAGWDILGTKETVKKLSREDFVDYRKKHYLADSSLVVIAGKFNEDEVAEKIRKSFASIPAGEKTEKVKTIESQGKPEILLKFKETDQTHLVLGVRSFDVFDERRYVLEILADVLGNGFSSRLFQRIREEMGAAYYIHAESELYSDHGYLSVSAGIDHNKINQVLEAALEEFRKIAKESLKEKELKRAKEHLIGHLIMGLETSEQLAGFYGGQEIITGKTVSPEEMIEKIQKVKSGEIIALAKEIFQNEKLNLALIGPFKEKEAFEKILKI